MRQPVDWPAITKAVVLAVIVLLVLYDFVAYAFGGRDATISIVSWQFASDHPIFAFILGMVFGHIFWKH
jgi:hypothetical protein